MTKDVLIIVSGTQLDLQEDAIELMVTGNYYFKNGKHYVLFEEQPEENGPITKNTVKFDDSFFEMTKRGGNNSYLRFDKGRHNTSMYQTPVGPVQVDVTTHELLIKEDENQIQVNVKYSLEINCQFVSECEVKFKVKRRGAGIRE